MTSGGRPLLDGLFDDAAIFPPAWRSIDEAVAAHRRWRAGAYGDLVGPFVAPLELLDDLPDDVRLALTLTGPDRLADAIAEAGARLAQLEIGSGSPAEVARAAQGLVCGLFVYVEVPAGRVTPGVCADLRAAGLRLKVRAGGVGPAAMPSDVALAAALHAAVAAGVPTKLTGGLQHAVRGADATTGVEHHGLGNVLLAVDAAVIGADEAELAEVLAQRDPLVVGAALRHLEGDRARAVRRVLASVGVSDLGQPLDELSDLGLLPLVRA